MSSLDFKMSMLAGLRLQLFSCMIRLKRLFSKIWDSALYTTRSKWKKYTTNKTFPLPFMLSPTWYNKSFFNVQHKTCKACIQCNLAQCLDIKWSKRGWFGNGPNFKWDLKSGRPIIWNSDKWLPFCQNHLKSGKSLNFEWSGLQMVGSSATTRPLENWTIWNPFKKSRFWTFLHFKWSYFRSQLLNLKF